MLNIIKKILVTTINEVHRFNSWLHSVIYFKSVPAYNKKYNLAVCSIFKNEARFLKEWIEYHNLIGVEHFFLYNNNSTDNYKEVLTEYIDSGLVTLTEWPYEQGQISAYKHFHETHWNESQWVSFIDIDEFFVPKKDYTLIDWIKRNDNYPVLLIYWKMFGSGGLLNHDDKKLCIEQYISSWESLVKCGKCLINTDYSIVSFNATTHHATRVRKGRCILYPKDLFNHINLNDKEIVLSKKKTGKADIQINHYWSKGWDVYDSKRIQSGDVFFKNNPKNNLYYFIKNELKNTTVDYTIYRYLLLLKWKMAKKTEIKEMNNTENIFDEQKFKC